MDASTDRFCSGLDWVLSVYRTWGRGLGIWTWRGECGRALFAFFGDAGGRRVLVGLDTIWGFACPLYPDEGAGPGGPAALAAEFAADTAGRPLREWTGMLIPGVIESSTLHRALLDGFAARCAVRTGPRMRRWIAHLDGGLDAYWARRPAKLRGNVRRAQRRARETGLEIVDKSPVAGVDDIDALYARVLDVERRSWKAAAGTGLLHDDMRRFYRDLSKRCARRGGLRLLFARRGGRDLGYILGAVRDGIYRGFQFSFDRLHAADSIGSLLQAAQLEALAREGVATYDMGIDLGYKRRWADEPLDTVTIVVVRT